MVGTAAVICTQARGRAAKHSASSPRCLRIELATGAVSAATSPAVADARQQQPPPKPPADQLAITVDGPHPRGCRGDRCSELALPMAKPVGDFTEPETWQFAIADDQQRIAAIGGGARRLFVLDAASGRQLASTPLDGETPCDQWISNLGGALYIMSNICGGTASEGVLYSWDAKRLARLGVNVGKTAPAMAGDHHYAFVDASGRRGEIRDLASGTLVAAFTVDHPPCSNCRVLSDPASWGVNPMQMTSDGKQLVVISDSRLAVIDVASGRTVRHFALPGCPVVR